MKATSFFSTLFFLASTISAQNVHKPSHPSIFIEGQNIIHPGEGITPIFKTHIKVIDEHKTIGMNAYFFVESHRAEGVFGAIYEPKSKYFDEFAVALSAGIETGSLPLRAQAFIELKKSRFRIESILEYGGSGFWHLFVWQYYLRESMRIGIQTETDAGIGPRFEISNGVSGLWINPAYDPEDSSFKANMGIYALF
jgi:hypothetical protein